MQNLPYRQKPIRERSEHIRGANTPLISTKGLWIRGQDVAKWPHPGGDLDACDFASFCLAGFVILAPGFDNTAFDL